MEPNPHPEAAESVRDLILSPWGFIPWFEHYGKIYNKSRRLISPGYYDDNGVLLKEGANPFQDRVGDAIAHCLVHGIAIRLIILKPRQKGSSTISTAALYWLSRRMAIKSIIMGAQYSQVGNLWEILETYHATDRFPWPNTGLVNAQRAEWSNGSLCGWETAGDSEAARSGTFQGLVATEAHRWPHGGKRDATAVLTGALNCVDDSPGTMVILESTASGDHGTFYDFWQDAADLDDLQAGRIPDRWNNYIRIFSPWHEHADSEQTLTREQAIRLEKSYTDEERAMVASYDLRPGHIAWYRTTLRSKCKRDPAIMKRENPATAEEAFHASSNRRFNTAGLRILEAQARQERAVAGILQPVQMAHGEPPAFMPCPDETLATVFVNEPPQPGLRYIVPVDIAEGRAQTESADTDRHAPLVLRAGYYDQHRGWRPPRVVAWCPEECRWPIDILADVVHQLSLYYGGALIVPERNNDRGLCLLLKQRGANLHEEISTDLDPVGARTPRATGKYGFLTVGGQAEKSRAWILEALDRRIREWDTEGDGLEVPDLATIGELKTFVVDKLTGRAEAAPGKHDDRVISLAIGLALENLATTYVVRRVGSVIPRDLSDHYEQREGAGLGAFS
jgi:hypothetical protein